MNYFSQYEQDKWLDENIFKRKTGGVCLEIGAANGLDLSNTAFFTKFRNWEGLCVEPIPALFNELSKNRPECCIISGAVWTEDCRKKFTLIEGYSEMLSGLSDTYDPRHAQRIKHEKQQYNQTVKEIDVHCYAIKDILDVCTFDAERGLDLLSIDTEGSEAEILKAINYEKYKIEVIIMENNYEDPDIREFLKSKGYELVARLGVDDLFRYNI